MRVPQCKSAAESSLRLAVPATVTKLNGGRSSSQHSETPRVAPDGLALDRVGRGHEHHVVAVEVDPHRRHVRRTVGSDDRDLSGASRRGQHELPPPAVGCVVVCHGAILPHARRLYDGRRVKIVSLLPSATEIVYALDLGDELCGVTFECDHPAEARTKPVVSGTRLTADDTGSAAAIDDAVRATVAAGESLYTLDAERIRTIQPDLILAQDLCRVCAVPSSAVDDALAVLGCDANVLSLDPSSLDDVIACVGAVGAATGRAAHADAVMAQLRARVDLVHNKVAALAAPRVLALEWSDPPFSAGHWVPDMIEAAGGVPVLAHPHEPSQRLDWRDIAHADIDTVVFMPCGYDLARAVDEGRCLAARAELAAARNVWAVHGNAYFSRPGPRVVDGVELLAALLHPDAVATDTTGRAVRLAGSPGSSAPR